MAGTGERPIQYFALVETLKTYFRVSEAKWDQSVRCKARILCEMLQDQNNFLYFHVLPPIVAEFEVVNAFGIILIYE